MRAAVLLFVLLLSISPTLNARGGSGHGSHGSKGSKSHSSKSKHTKTVHSTARPFRRGYVASGYTAHPTVQRDSHGRIKRSRAARDSFMRQHPCPSTGKASGRCPGYVVDHVRALECGGADAPGNMQWQTTAAAKAKDRTERYCR